MEGRLACLASLVAAAWGLGSTAPITSTILTMASLGGGGWYAFMLFKTLQGTNVKHIFWGSIGKIVVNRYLTRHEFFRVDLPPEDVARKREEGFRRLEVAWRERWPKSRETNNYLLKHFSDFRFKASGFESTFPLFQEVVNEALMPGTIVDHSEEGNTLVDVDGFRFLDASGSYGVNCFGLTRFKEMMKHGHELSQKLGPCLGPMHPVVAENIQMLLKIFNKEEASFHMSGTEAVMTAVTQVRFHTERPLIAAFDGAYHGWWDGMMQGAGNERFNSDIIILKDQSQAALDLLKLRAHEIAGVMVNPINGFGWQSAKTATLGHCKVHAGVEAIERYKVWLCKLRKVCTDCQIPLIYDETWAFQLGPGGAQELYGVQADIVTVGKAVGGGHAVGVVLGSHKFMERRDPHRPMRVSFCVGTFKGSPVVMGAMNAVLKWVTSSDGAAAFNGLKDRVEAWKKRCNLALTKEGLPISVAAYRSTWCICYHQPSVYQFMFQYYLRDAGLYILWVGTSKMLLNLEYTESDLDKLTEIILSAARAFKADGWWWEGGSKVSLLPYVLGPTLRFHWARFLAQLGL